MARHHHKLSQALTSVAAGRITRLICEEPPRHGKSEQISKYFPAWYLGIKPRNNIILTGATDELARMFGSASRSVFRETCHWFGTGLSVDSTAAHRWQTTQGGGLLAAGVGGDVMGRGANVLIIDDYVKSVEEAQSETIRRKIWEWYLATVSSRLMPGGAVIVVATRWHPDDLIGRLLADETRGGDKWQRIRFPALAENHDELGRAPGDPLWPEQFDLAALSAIERKYAVSGYTWMWDALYQQNPPSTLNNEFPREWFGESIWFDAWPHDIANAEPYEAWAMAIDPSLGKTDKSDYSAIVWGGWDRQGTLWIDADVQRRPASKMIDDALSLCQEVRPERVGVEAVAFQDLLRQSIDEKAAARRMYVDVAPIHQKAAKVVRIRRLDKFLSQGRIKFRRGSPGVSLLIEQLMGFPSHKHDDGPDALEMLIRLLHRMMTGGVGSAYTNEEEFEW